MADFTIASQVGGGGGGQNAMASGFNPNTMFQLMQMKQTMELQRLAEQRAAAAEGRAAAMHVPQLGAANLRLQEAEMDLKKKREEDEISNLYHDIRTRYKDPFSDEALSEAKNKSAKLYSTLLDQKAAQGKLAAETDVKTKEGLLKGLELNQKTAGLWLPAIENGLVTDQKTYSAMREDLLRGQNNFASVFPEEYSPEAVKKFQQAFSGTKDITTQSMAGGDVLVLVNGKPYGMVDPTIKDGAVPGVRPFGPGEAPAVPTTAAPATVQPRAAVPQTMGFSGMGQLTPRTQNAAQNVLSTIPGARITSGLRTPERNAAVGGAQFSAHLRGDAFDTVPPAGMPMNVFAAQVRAQLEPLGYKVMYGDPGHLDHVHVQPGSGDAMNTPRQFNPSIAATDVAAGRTPTSMFAPANAMVPLAAMSLMQPQNAMVQTPANIAPGLTAAATPAAGVAAPATATPEAGAPPRREDYATYGQFVEAQKNYRVRQEKLADQAAADRRALEAEARKAKQEIDIFKQKEGIKAAAETQKKEEAELKSVNDLLPELRSITAPGGLISQSTGSGAGAAFDTTAAFFGAATEGAKAAARLKPIADAALKAVPRFEGPQSDKDTQSYKEAAGELANEKLPRETRIAAGQEMLRLLQKRQVQIEMKRGDTSTARRPSDMTVIAPNGTPYNFPTKEQADAYFKQVYK